MKSRLSLFLPLFALSAAIAHGQQPVPSGEFTKIQLTDQFWAEGAAIGDFNHDGKMDVVYGPYWWEGPDFKVKHTYRPDTDKSKVKTKDGTEIEISGFKGALGQRERLLRQFPDLHLRLQWRRLDRYPGHRLAGQGSLLVRKSERRGRAVAQTPGVGRGRQ
ncbi:MAG: VCBS repeat-containing protein [Chthoniobacter sp.]